MAHGKKVLRLLIGRLKDGTSVLKATLSTKHKTKVRSAILRATSHDLSAPPSDKREAAVLFHASESLQAASSCVSVLMDRLNATKSLSVALKCLFTIHAIITKGPFVLKDQLSYYPSFGGRNFLNLSQFSDYSELETRELSSWVRWYAAVLEHNLTVSRYIGHYLCSSLYSIGKDKEEKALTMLSSVLLEEMEVLIGFVEQICDFPDSLNLQKIGLVYEIVMLVSEDYRSVQHEIFHRVSHLRTRIPSLSFKELAQIVNILKRLDGCRERLRLLFVNRKRFDALWEMTGDMKMMILEILKEKEMKSLMEIEKIDNSAKLTRFRGRFAEIRQLVPVNYSEDQWMVPDQVPLTIVKYE